VIYVITICKRNITTYSNLLFTIGVCIIGQADKQQRRKSSSFSFLRQGKRRGDKIFRIIVIGAACYTLLMVGLVAFSVGNGSKDIFLKEGFLKFLTGTDWNSVEGRESYGALPYIIGTLVSSAISIEVGVPVSIGIASLLSEISHAMLSTP
jgi:phosphate transport system permease protein